MVLRCYFSVDVHGNTIVWRKWINAVNVYKANVLILSGDLTGKAIIPIYDKNGYYEAEFLGRKYTINNNDELKKLEEQIENIGYYYKVMTMKEAQELAADEKKLENLFKELITERIRKWMDLLLEKVNTREVIVMAMPGNDDEFWVDEVIKEYGDRGIIYPLDKIVELPYGYEVVSNDYVNPTPWKTPREVDEKKLEKMLEEKIKKVHNMEKAIFNFHPPPYNTKLDLAPKLDKNMKIVYVGGKPLMIHVGSTAVRKMIEKYQPLMGLHGHIHESYASDKIGRTIVVNPGSEYTEGILRGFIIELDEHGIKNYWKVEG